ncbi:MAG: C39 family peptidase [Patescibacteria group bacterium]
MKRGYVIIASTAVLLVVLGGFGYAMRGQIRDTIAEARKPDLPAAVPYESANVNAASAPAPAPTTPKNVNVAPPPPKNVNTNAPAANTNINAPVVNANVNVAPAPVAQPAAYNLAVPWTVQAPFANWTGSYEDGCEEASALMVHYYYSKQVFDSQQESKDELDKIFAWENTRYGYNLNTTAEETATTIREYFGYTTVVVTEEVTAARIKSEIAAGRPVIVPAYGKALNNPNFKNGGPVYHMLVVKGYTANTFITDDPGTRKGADYVYPISTILNAAHDWNDGDTEHGRKVMIVVHPNW